MNRNMAKAADGLVYYFQLLFEKQGLYWDSDNETEIRQIIENIFDGVDDLIDNRIDKHISSVYHAE